MIKTNVHFLFYMHFSFYVHFDILYTSERVEQRPDQPCWDTKGPQLSDLWWRLMAPDVGPDVIGDISNL